MEVKEHFCPIFPHCNLTHTTRHHAAWLVPDALGKTRRAWWNIIRHFCRLWCLYRDPQTAGLCTREVMNTIPEGGCLQLNHNTDSYQACYFGRVRSPPLASVFQYLKPTSYYCPDMQIKWDNPWQVSISAWHVIW